MKKTIIIILAIFLVVTTLVTGCSMQSKKEKKDMTEDILATFEEICAVPHPTHHEEQISKFLKEWAEKNGFDVIQDKVNNIIVEVPATKGMEDKDKVVLQGHMDMVFAQKPGLDLDPLTTPIKVVNDGTYLTSDGNTSLGVDDGIGLAIMMEIAEGKMEHGPLRLLITVDEEDSQTGVKELSPEYLKDVKYLINLDSEKEGEACISAAAGTQELITREIKPQSPSLDKAIKIEIKDSLGGHSGEDINKGRLNAIISLGKLFKSVNDKEIDFEIGGIDAGTAKNAIPNYAKAYIFVSSDNFDKVVSLLNEKANEIKKEYESTDADGKFEVSEADANEIPSSVISADDKEAVIKLVNNLFDGVNTMSKDIPDLVESSSNLGTLKIADGIIEAKAFVRSSSKEELNKILEDHAKVIEESGFSVEVSNSSATWPIKKDNKLLDVADEAYKSIFNTELKNVAIHAGLECGQFSEYNNDISMIAIGPTIEGNHSISEKLTIDTINKVWLLVEGILKNI